VFTVLFLCSLYSFGLSLGCKKSVFSSDNEVCACRNELNNNLVLYILRLAYKRLFNDVRVRKFHINVDCSIDNLVFLIGKIFVLIKFLIICLITTLLKEVNNLLRINSVRYLVFFKTN